MQFNGSTEFAADRDRVWSYFIDPSRLGPCAPIPIQRVDDRHFRATARVGSGFFATNVQADLELTDVVERERAAVAGSGGAVGTTVQARAAFNLRDGASAGHTIVDWSIDLEPRGSFASAITRAIQERAPAAIDELLACIHREIEG